MEVGRVRSEAQGVPTSVEFRAIFWHLIWRSLLSIFGSSVIPVLRIWVGRKADQELDGETDALLATTRSIAAMANYNMMNGFSNPYWAQCAAHFPLSCPFRSVSAFGIKP